MCKILKFINMRYLLCFFSGLMLWLGCENPPIPETPTDKLANALCHCTDTLFRLNETAQKSADSLSFRKIALAFEQSKKCVQQIQINPADQVLVEAALVQKCPRLAQEKALLLELLSR